MKVATSLVSGNEPLPALAHEATRRALSSAGLTQAGGVLLFLTPEFSRHAQAAVTASARASRCTQIAGGIASGLFTQSDWALDRPAVAVMVFSESFSPDFTESSTDPLLGYSGSSIPEKWLCSRRRFGGFFSGSVAYAEPAVWQQGRLSDTQTCSVCFPAAEIALGVSHGLKLLAPPLPIEAARAYDLERMGGKSAAGYLEALLETTPVEPMRKQLHSLTALLADEIVPPETAFTKGQYRSAAILSANANQSLTLTERVRPGQYLAWAIRLPEEAESDMKRCVGNLAQQTSHTPPCCALMFSCIGRGPYFYGGEDRDLDVLKARFPNLPVLGVYGTGQIAPSLSKDSTNELLHNCVVTALLSRKPPHVQSIS